MRWNQGSPEMRGAAFGEKSCAAWTVMSALVVRESGWDLTRYWASGGAMEVPGASDRLRNEPAENIDQYAEKTSRK